ncbi:MAG: hypothetical protein GEU90_11250 [Gemmatimonas sp.]|nr:hypothetical protein [Gemmatimonas sp.]
MLSVGQAVLIGGVLILVDLGARSLRLIALLKAVGADLRTAGACIATAFGDAASVLTPFRVGGTPARLAVLHRYRVPLSLGLGALALELLTYQAIVGLVGVFLATQVAPTLPGPGAFWSLPSAVLAVAAAAVLGAILIAFPWLRARFRRSTAQLRRLPRRLKQDPNFWKGIAASLPLAVISVIARLSLLPLLALSLPPNLRPPELSALAFAVTFGQILVPTPAGAGAVEYAFAATGVAATPGMTSIFVAWRALTVGVVVSLGLALAVLACGKGILAAAFPPLRASRRRRTMARRSDRPGSV